MPPRTRKTKIETVDLPDSDICGGSGDEPCAPGCCEPEKFVRCAPDDGEPCCGSPESIADNMIPWPYPKQAVLTANPLILDVVAGQGDRIVIDIDDIYCDHPHVVDLTFTEATTQSLLDVLGPLLDEIDDRGIDLNDHDEYVKSDATRKYEHRPKRETLSDLIASLTPEKPKKNILEEALSIVTGARRNAYGHPENNFGRIVGLWQPYLDNRVGGRDAPLTTIDVSLLMVLMKVARLQETPTHRDSAVDIAGYAATLEMLWDGPA